MNDSKSLEMPDRELSSHIKQLEEFQLIKFSLLPDEHLTFLDDDDVWASLIEAHTELDLSTLAPKPQSELTPVRIQVTTEISQVYFVIEVPVHYAGVLADGSHPTFAVKGDQTSRSEHDRWQHIIEERLLEIGGTEFPIYQLLILHLLPLVREEVESRRSQVPLDELRTGPEYHAPRYHALLTSHHLISPNKRRSLQNWSSSLSISGFAKVGYPGVIYVQGQKGDVEEFVGNTKAMQWLALKIRFIEELPGEQITHGSDQGWQEFQKVGEVVEEMRRLGKEQFIVEMGIGSAGTK